MYHLNVDGKQINDKNFEMLIIEVKNLAMQMAWRNFHHYIVNKYFAYFNKPIGTSSENIMLGIEVKKPLHLIWNI